MASMKISLRAGVVRRWELHLQVQPPRVSHVDARGEGSRSPPLEPRDEQHRLEAFMHCLTCIM